MVTVSIFEDNLKSLGFTAYESRVYVSLVRNGICSAPEISKDSEVPKSKIYTVIEGLLNKRMIEEFPGSPRKFKARSPNSVVDEILMSKRDEFRKIEKDSDGLKKSLNAILDQSEKKYLDSDSVLWTVNGRKAFHEKFAEMIKRARSSIDVITPTFSRNSILEDAMYYAKSKNVKLNALTKIDDDNHLRIKFYLSYFDQMLKYEGDLPITLLIVDNEECLYRIKYYVGSQVNYVGVHSANPGLVQAFIQYWNGLADKCEVINSLDD
ncbi:MAG: TrmB family transcriptional regulator [Candidatus Aenigmarchaeota archaeon]|nr:TrmB family transcriptional regulator [Candidatus Aenigmarchaeota archaeon]